MTRQLATIRPTSGGTPDGEPHKGPQPFVTCLCSRGVISRIAAPPLGFPMRLSSAVFACLISFALAGAIPAAAQVKQRNLAERCAKPDFVKKNPKSCAQYATPAT